YLVPLGTTGESVTLTKDEKRAVLDFVIEVNEKRLPIVLGLGGNNTNDIIQCMEDYPLKSVSAILSVSPYYNKPSQRGLLQHYKSIANSSPVPVIIYNVPSRTSVNISADTTLLLAEEDNIIGVKEASGNFDQCMRILKNKPKDFLFISGDDALTFPLMALGADGVISVVANAYPKEFSEMVRSALEGNYDRARKIHYRLLTFTNLLFVEGSPSGIKAALKMLHICDEYLRLPLVGISKTTWNRMEDAIKEI
ncbi:MAG: 4-hydroxy-tetrahydrodipicolinate synthase, partial [Bacteroidia bacterium]|nr:4-hydroxy-tetrahydrodipicolinate synthase [Bacteroidia bacterium]